MHEIATRVSLLRPALSSRSVGHLRTSFTVAVAHLRLTTRRAAFWFALLGVAGLGVVFFTDVIALSSGGAATTEPARNGAFGLSMLLCFAGALTAPIVVSLVAGIATRDRASAASEMFDSYPTSRRAVLAGKAAAAAAVAAIFPVALVVAAGVAQFGASAAVTLMAPNLTSPFFSLFAFGLPFSVLISALAFFATRRASTATNAYLSLAIAYGYLAVCYALARRPEYRHFVILDPLGFLQLFEASSTGLSVDQLNAIDWMGRPELLANRSGVLSVAAVVFAVAVGFGERGLVPGRKSARRKWALSLPIPLNGGRRWRSAVPASRFLAVVYAQSRRILNDSSWLWFLPIAGLWLWRSAAAHLGPFNAEMTPTSAVVAFNTVWIVSVAAVLMSMWLGAELGIEQRGRGATELELASSAPALMLVVGRWLAVVSAVIVLMVFAIGVGVAYQIAGGQPVGSLKPYFDLFLGVVIPTASFMAALCLLATCAVGHRNGGVAVGVVLVIAHTGLVSAGFYNWWYNPSAFGMLTYSGISGFGPVTSSVWIHRGYVLAVAVGVVGLASLCVQYRARAERSVMPERGSVALVGAATVGALFLGLVLVAEVEKGRWSIAGDQLSADYERSAKPWLASAPKPMLRHVSLDVELHPATRGFRVAGRYLVDTANTSTSWYITANPGLVRQGRLTVDGHSLKMLLPGLYEVSASGSGRTISEIEFAWSSTAPLGLAPRPTRLTSFVYDDASLLTSMSPWAWLPVIGYSPELELTDQRTRTDFALGTRTIMARAASPEHGLLFHDNPFRFDVRVRAPRDQTVVASAVSVGSRDIGDRREWSFEAPSPIYFFAITAGRWHRQSSGEVSVFAYADHQDVARSVLDTAVRAKAVLTDVFGPYPNRSLSLVELPQIGVWAAVSFPGVVPISEDIGFLTTATSRRTNAREFIVAHEVAHAWWGNGVWPNEAPGSFVLTEGLATYAAVLYVARVHGEPARQALFEDMEYFYLRSRDPRQEQPLTEIDGSRFTDITAMYQRAGLVLQMLADVVGEERLLASLSRLYRQHASSHSHPTLEQLLADLRGVDPWTDEFIGHYIEGTAVPNIRVQDVVVAGDKRERLEATVVLRNVGTGPVRVPIRMTGTSSEGQRCSVTVSVRVNNVEETRATLPMGSCRPSVVEIDPERRILLQERHRARLAF